MAWPRWSVTASAGLLAWLILITPAVANAPGLSHLDAHTLARRADYCKTETVIQDDSCGALVERCGITSDELTKYNKDNLCSTLRPGQKVCCTEGDLQPHKSDNGTCYTYTIKDKDTCYDLGLVYSLTNDEIDGFNNGTTWGWTGCDGGLVVGLNMCLSDGYPPAPSPLENALCGPQVPGATFDGTVQNAADLAELNPCPLNACCNIWGQCGIDKDFCTEALGPSGNPGTSPPGTNGCISNCGTDIVNNESGPSEFLRVGYYEAFNWDRGCLHMRAGWSNTDSYTHMHWAFGTVNADLSIMVNDSYNQWDAFMSLKNTKKVVSFGGWGFSTEVATYDIIRKGMSDENRAQFVANIVQFAESTGIDGIDFDWEYPGAPDIPGIPPGLESDGPNYLATLKALRSALPDKYSISIAAPASYWYLKSFPIGDMHQYLDYIVYMAYDLHGQWDYDNDWAQSGCKAGNCLRSHVNETEVELALAMVTKAGVPSTKIMVGESSYGRSFNMATAGCTGPECTYTGSGTTSDATPGRCTNTGGYISNAEINEIIAKNSNANTWHDDETNSDYLVYNDLQWVAYMSDDTKEARREKWKGLNFGGTIDWAVDLQEFNSADTLGPTGDYNESSVVNVFDQLIWDWVNPGVEAPVSATNIIQASPLPEVVTLTAYTTLTLQSGQSLSSTFISTVFSISELSFQPFTIAESDTSSGTVLTYKPVPSVNPAPFTVPVPAGWTITSAVSASTTHLVGLSTSTSSSTDAGGFVVMYWNPTVSYSLPSRVTPKIVAPTVIPENEDDPIETPVPGVTDCSGAGCTVGTDCSGDGCTRGGDCIGPSCTKGGSCTGPNCVRGGECQGDSCTEGGGCSGDSCVEGGGCSGANCGHGGGCSGPNCNKGGGCVSNLFKSCSSGDCEGSNCNSETQCTQVWCHNHVTLTVKPPVTIPTPSVTLNKPKCLVGCPTLAPCPDGGTSCNTPCNLQKCPPGRMPTAKDCTTFTTALDCTAIVSSSAVQTSPTTSWSTNTRTHCDTMIDCDITGVTVTTTITSSESALPTADATGTYDYWDDSAYNDANIYAAIESDYEDWDNSAEATSTTSTKQASTTTTTQVVTHTPQADCAYWGEGFYLGVLLYNIRGGWADEDEGAELKKQENGCGGVSDWDWHDADDDSYAYVYYYLPGTLKAGCVERAIASAGGPKLSCEDQGYGNKPELEGDKNLGRRDLSVLNSRSPVDKRDPLDEGRYPSYTPMQWPSPSSEFTTDLPTRRMTTTTIVEPSPSVVEVTKIIKRTISLITIAKPTTTQATPTVSYTPYVPETWDNTTVVYTSTLTLTITLNGTDTGNATTTNGDATTTNSGEVTLTSSAEATPTGSTVSPDGSCGGTTGYTCLGSEFGDCCSTYGYCGSTASYCSTYCDSAFGTCDTGTKVSGDGSCGGDNGYTCIGSEFGDCCSIYGYW
ncbi:hypothetical protein E8E14_006528 [Neopestalotiopsis sp. 37M]|nr:hypothetical protein E8E14_006528 [Neopestalotiopsis sp. 37M]